jgi:hypothetical protein
MPLFERITYSAHATLRMRQRRISNEDVALVLRIGQGFEDENGNWVYELGRLRVIIDDRAEEAHVVTAIKLRGRP